MSDIISVYFPPKLNEILGWDTLKYEQKMKFRPNWAGQITC